MNYNYIRAGVSFWDRLTDKEAREFYNEMRPAFVWEKELYDPSGKKGEIITEDITFKVEMKPKIRDEINPGPPRKS